MSPTDIVELYILSGDQLDASWEFFVTVHLAILAALYGIEKLRKLKWLEYCFLGIGYLGFSFINLRAKLEAYKCLIAIERDAEDLLVGTDLKMLTIFFQNIQFGDREIIALVVHALAFFGIFFLTKIIHDSK